MKKGKNTKSSALGARPLIWVSAVKGLKFLNKPLFWGWPIDYKWSDFILEIIANAGNCNFFDYCKMKLVKFQVNDKK